MRSGRAGLAGLLALAALAAWPPGPAAGAVNLTLQGGSEARGLMCGDPVRVRVTEAGSRVTALTSAKRGRLVAERCADGRWRRLRSARLSGGEARRVDATRAGDYRLSVRAGARRRTGFAHLRVLAGEPLVRKDAAALSAPERADFVAGLHRLKSVPSPFDPKLSYYDQLVDWHVHLTACDPADPLARDLMRGHSGPMFLPWHRQYLLLLERALREVTGKDIAVPYWNWSSDASTRAVFSDDLMGGDGDPGEGYAVTTGPFRKGSWRLNVQNFGLVWAPSNTRHITRRFGGSPSAPARPTAADFEVAARAPLYDSPPFDDSSDPAQSFRHALEGYRNPVGLTGCLPDGSQGTVPLGEANLHNRAHVWVGGLLPPSSEGALRFGTLAVNVASPNDPVFFLLHSNVDRLWAHWQAIRGTDTYRPISGLPHNNADDVMHPLEEAGPAATPADVADIAELGYAYGDPVTAAGAPRALAVPPGSLACRL